MTTIQFILIVIAALIVLAGLFMVIRGLKRRHDDEALASVEYDKNGIPIIPRHERNLIDQPDFEDTVAGETTITPNRSHLSAVIEENAPSPQHSHSDASFNDHYDEHYEGNDAQGHSWQTASSHVTEKDNSESFNEEYAQWQARQKQADDREFDQIATELEGHDGERDAFSTLLSATENLMPVIETAEEPAFTDNSPVLDRHLLAAADYDQNSPLNNATDNINLTLLPQSHANGTPVLIRGEAILRLVDKFGVKYGPMNMFHRYENKDGTGILWFSMMGITEEGIAPFDLNIMPQTAYSGLVLFLSLPHPKALQGFDSMISIAGLMARELNCMVLDENNEPLTVEEKNRLRTQVQEYQSNSRQAF